MFGQGASENTNEQFKNTVGVKIKFPVSFRSTKPNQYTVLTKNSYKTDKRM